MKRCRLSLLCTLLLTQPILALAENPVTVGPVSSSPHLAMGKPGYGVTGNTVIARRGYACLYNDQKKTPLWVSYYLTSTNLKKSVPRKDAFAPDPDLVQGFCSLLSDYERSGFDRGHMAPCEDMSRDKKTQRESFYLSNMVPQSPKNNQQFWKNLEGVFREYTKNNGSLYIITGPIYGKPLPAGYKSLPASIGRDRVAVPTWLYKIAVRKLPDGHYEAFAVEVPNAAINTKAMGMQKTMEKWSTSIRRIEKETGLNFFNSLPQAEQDRFETVVTRAAWSVTSMDTSRGKKSGSR